jgi:hypothetical protein
MVVKLFFQPFGLPPVELGDIAEEIVTPNIVKSLLTVKAGYTITLAHRFAQCLFLSNPQTDFSKPTAKYIIQKQDTELIFGWRTEIRLFPATEKFQSKNVIATFTFSSCGNISFHSLFQEMKTLYPDSFFVTKDQQLISSDSQAFYENPVALFDIYLVPKKTKYSDSSLVTISAKIRFHQSNGRKRTVENDIDCIQKACMTYLAQSFVLFNSSAAFEKVVDSILTHLEALHKAYDPTDDLSEAGRRLIINVFIIHICAFIDKTFRVEDHVFKNNEPGELGWGPFDYSFPNHAICRANIEDIAESYEALEGTMDLAEDQEIQAHSLEAKKVVELQGYCQLAAQLFDVAAKCGLTQVRGILSTGTHWKFFSLYDPSHPVVNTLEPPPHPGDNRFVMVLEGVADLNIIKSQPNSTTRRPNAASGPILNREQIRRIAAYLILTL